MRFIKALLVSAILALVSSACGGVNPNDPCKDNPNAPGCGGGNGATVTACTFNVQYRRVKPITLPDATVPLLISLQYEGVNSSIRGTVTQKPGTTDTWLSSFANVPANSINKDHRLWANDAKVAVGSGRESSTYMEVELTVTATEVWSDGREGTPEPFVLNRSEPADSFGGRFGLVNVTISNNSCVLR